MTVTEPSLEVTASVIVNAPAETVFAGLTSWDRQGEWIPFTTVRVVEGDGGEGSQIEAVTAVGPAVLRDEMRVTRLDPPYEIQVLHTGKVLRGPGVMRCTPMGQAGDVGGSSARRSGASRAIKRPEPGDTGGTRTQVVWHEWFHLPGGLVGRLAGPALWPGSKIGLTRALRRFARLVEDGTLP